MTADAPIWVAIAAGVPGLIAVTIALVLWVRLRRVRAEQRVLLPDGAEAGLVERQSAQHLRLERLIEDIAGLHAALADHRATIETTMRSTLRFHGLVRYDAFTDIGGAQSWSVALLDATRSGSIITSLHARDHARVYLKQLVAGTPSQRLSPEEERAVALALGEEAGEAVAG